MVDYLGSKCIVCGKAFTEDDNIVVCPDCGTPYHSDCYKKEGKCINSELHNSHRTWQPESVKPSPQDASERIICPNCGFSNAPKTFFCGNCGAPLETFRVNNDALRRQINAQGYQQRPNINNQDYNQTQQPNFNGIDIQPFLINFADPLCGYNPQEDFDGVRLCELGDFVGDNTHYYLPAFKRIKDTGRAMTWNFSAMIFPELFFANRKMPLIALACAVVRLVTEIPFFLTYCATITSGPLAQLAASFDIRSGAFQALEIMSYILLYGMMFFCGSFANWIYYRKSVKKTAKIKESVPPQEWRQTLRRKGGTSAAWLTLFIVLCLVPYFFLNLFLTDSFMA